MKTMTALALLTLTVLLALGATPADAGDDCYFQLRLEISVLRSEIAETEARIVDIDRALAYYRERIAMFESLLAVPLYSPYRATWQYEAYRLRALSAALEAEREDLSRELSWKRVLLRMKVLELGTLDEPTLDNRGSLFDGLDGGIASGGSTSDGSLAGGTSSPSDTDVKN